MYKTGDLLKNIEKLKIELKQIKYPEKIDIDSLTEGNPLIFLPILHFSLLSYSKYVAEFLLENKYELFSKSDKDFVNKIFKAMIELFNYKPTLNPRQFFMSGYAEAKVIFSLEVIRLVKLEHNKLIKKAFSVSVKNTNANTINKNKSKLNDSYRSNKSSKSNISNPPPRDDFLEYISNDRVRVVNHQKNNLRKELDMNLKSEIEVQMASPKFNDDEKIEYNGRAGNKKYNFNQNFTKNVTVIKNGKNNSEQHLLKQNQEEGPIFANNFTYNNNILPSKENLDWEDSQEQENHEQNIINDKFHENSSSKNSQITNFAKTQQIKINKSESINNKLPHSNQTNNKISNDFSSVVEIINSLAISIRDMTIKIDTFKNNIEDRVSNLEAEISLVKNKVNILESNNISKNSENKSLQQNIIPSNGTKISMSISESYSNSNMLNQSSIDNNEHIFSFADDHQNVVNTQQNQESFNKIENQSIKYSTISGSQNRNALTQMGTSNFTTNNNQLISRMQNNAQQSIENSQVNYNSNFQNSLPIQNKQASTPPFMNKISTKILTDIEDTDSIIQKVANRFKETQKLLNEFK
jgi:hypothetical protein